MLRSVSLSRAIPILTAFGVGWVVYMVGMVLTVYDGIASLIFQPMMAALWSSSVVLLSLLVGLLLRLRHIVQIWNGSTVWAASIVGTSSFVLTFGYFVGMTFIVMNPETKQQIVVLHPAAALGTYFFLLFGITNWPVRRPEPHARSTV